MLLDFQSLTCYFAHVISHMFWMKFMCDLSRITKTENRGRSVSGDCGICGDIHFHHCDCLYRAPCKWHTYCTILFHICNMTWKVSVTIACPRFNGFANIYYFLQESMSNTTIQYVHLKNNICLYFFHTINAMNILVYNNFILFIFILFFKCEYFKTILFYHNIIDIKSCNGQNISKIYIIYWNIMIEYNVLKNKIRKKSNSVS